MARNYLKIMYKKFDYALSMREKERGEVGFISSSVIILLFLKFTTNILLYLSCIFLDCMIGNADFLNLSLIALTTLKSS